MALVRPAVDLTAQSLESAGGFPARRMRRLRRTETLRRMVRETSLAPADFIYPLFVAETMREPTPIRSMPGQYAVAAATPSPTRPARSPRSASAA